ncbi:MAG: DUF192 domain-containing protein [Rickettsiales bacterium]|jgi:uncharacterized membrane protein (UPF0127 family)|nr:DUF192 domain-containing protein [Rickettsiales bacterium]
MKKTLIAVLALAGCAAKDAPCGAKIDTENFAIKGTMPDRRGEGVLRGSWKIEVADTDEKRLAGFMNRKSIPPETGMLFIFDTADDWSMWMKNTLVPLDMVFADENGTVTAVARNTPPLSEEHITPCGVQFGALAPEPADPDAWFDDCEAEYAEGAPKATKYVLEVPAGGARLVRPGDTMEGLGRN